MIKTYLSMLCLALCFLGVIGCGPDRIEIFSDNAKKVIDPIELQNWAVAVLSTNHNFYFIANTNVPMNVRQLMSEGFPMEFAAVNDSDHIDLAWGGGFGHWGISVGSKTYTLKTDASCIEWKPGIYFFEGP